MRTAVNIGAARARSTLTPSSARGTVPGDSTSVKLVISAVRTAAVTAALASVPALAGADAPTPAPVPTPTPPLFDTVAPIPLGTPCPGEVGGEVRQTASYTPSIAISAASRAAFFRENDPGIATVNAFLFTYLDGHNSVLVRNSDRIDDAFRAALHTYGATIRTAPVLEGCPHLGGVFAIVVDVATGRVRLVDRQRRPAA